MSPVPAHKHPELTTDEGTARVRRELAADIAALAARLDAVESAEPEDIPGDLVLVSPDGTEWTLDVSDAGVLSAYRLPPEVAP